MMIINKDWYVIENVEQIDSPALVIYLDRVKENIRLLKTMIDDPQRLRPHVKTHKSKEAAQLLMEAGIHKFKCATIAEADMLGSAGAPDVLLAYQPLGPKVNRLVRLIQHYPATQYSCLIDNMEAAKKISEAAQINRLSIPVYIDLNVGMNRTGIAPGSEALQLYQQSAQLKGITPVGFHIYDGHIKNPDLQVRKKECDAAFGPVEQMKNALIDKGFFEPVIVAGGTPAFPVHAQRKKVECSPGTFIYWDAGYEEVYTEQHFFPAALIISRVVSLPDATKICLDLGYKSVSSENELSRRISFLNAHQLKFAGQSEEHLVVDAGVNHHFKIGDVLYGLPYHICPTVALYERALVIEEGKVAGEWKIISRDRKINY